MIYRIFMDKYRGVLTLEKPQGLGPTHAYYSWNDQFFSEYMIHLISVLEPKEDPKGTLIIEEYEEFSEITFYTKGAFAMGYTLYG